MLGARAPNRSLPRTSHPTSDSRWNPSPRPHLATKATPRHLTPMASHSAPQPATRLSGAFSGSLIVSDRRDAAAAIPQRQARVESTTPGLPRGGQLCGRLHRPGRQDLQEDRHQRQRSPCSARCWSATRPPLPRCAPASTPNCPERPRRRCSAAPRRRTATCPALQWRAPQSSARQHGPREASVVVLGRDVGSGTRMPSQRRALQKPQRAHRRIGELRRRTPHGGARRPAAPGPEGAPYTAQPATRLLGRLQVYA